MTISIFTLLRLDIKMFVYAVFKVRAFLSGLFPDRKVLGGHLLSHIVSNVVPSAARVLTIVFEMGTGVSPGRIATEMFRY